MTLPSPDLTLVFSLFLFFIGVVGIILRRNLIVVLMCIELMLNAVNFCVVVISQNYQRLDGSMLVFFTLTIGAAETAVGLALITALFKLGIDPTEDALKELNG